MFMSVSLNAHSVRTMFEELMNNAFPFCRDIGADVRFKISALKALIHCLTKPQLIVSRLNRNMRFYRSSLRDSLTLGQENGPW